MKYSKPSKNTLKDVKFGNVKIEYVVRRRDVKYPRLEFNSEVLSVILPKGMKDEKEILEKKNRWIKRKYHLIKKALKIDKNLSNSFLIFGSLYKLRKTSRVEKFEIDYKNKEIEINKENSAYFRKYLKRILRVKVSSLIRELTGNRKKFNKIYIRTQKTKWASCSSKKNLSVNLKLVSLPERLLKYVIFHEILHLEEKKHNHWFWEQVKRKFPGYKALEKKLFGYWFLTEKLMRNL